MEDEGPLLCYYTLTTEVQDGMSVRFWDLQERQVQSNIYKKTKGPRVYFHHHQQHYTVVDNAMYSSPRWI
jgi:hypothetical protein